MKTSQTFDATNEWEVESLIHEFAHLFTDRPYCDDRDLQDTISLLQDTDADLDAIAVAVLRGIRSTARISEEAIGKRLSVAIADLYRRAEQLDQLSINVRRGEVQNEVSNRRVDFSRLLVTMVDDPRVVIIHLAEMLIQMRQAVHLPKDEQMALSKQVLSTYTPLANKLGMWRFKWELEDLAFKCLNRREFNQIVRQLDGRRKEREAYIESFVKELQMLMDRSNIRAVVNGRAKHLFGIWSKLSRKGVGFDSLFDVRAVRILVDDVASCYAALGAVHATWPVLAGEFDDYIAHPKPNGYQSLHTAIYGPDSKTVEVQIRTWTMHDDCEFGVTAHWLYKEGSQSSEYQEKKIRLLRQLMEWKAEAVAAASGNDASSGSDQLANTYVFTPAGKVVELPAFSTPIDFAYFIHTEVGHRCRGARVNGRLVPLTHVLKTGEWVEIQTVKSGGPSRDWLSTHHNYVASSRAKACIRRWFKLEEYGRYETLGRTMLERELNRHGLPRTGIDRLALNNGYRNSQAFLAAIGMKELKPAHAIANLVRPPPAESDIRLPKKLEVPSSPSLSILGVANLLTNHASCCSPLPGDDIVGYITVARGITIHKSSCGNLRRMLDSHPDRLVPVDWEHDGETKYPVEIELLAEGGADLLREITTMMATQKASVVALNSPQIPPGEIGRIRMTVEIGAADELNNVLTKLRGLDQVVRARRMTI